MHEHPGQELERVGRLGTGRRACALHDRWVGNVTKHVLANVIIDHYFFGVAAVDKDGHESLAAFPR